MTDTTIPLVHHYYQYKFKSYVLQHAINHLCHNIAVEKKKINILPHIQGGSK